MNIALNKLALKLKKKKMTDNPADQEGQFFSMEFYQNME